ncbi:hypothetical protein MAHJHV47_46370 [Mycobacterium avium subsp. hominissuis]
MLDVGKPCTNTNAGAPVDLILTNANIYLPLANLTAFQSALLDPATARATAAAGSSSAL